MTVTIGSPSRSSALRFEDKKGKACVGLTTEKNAINLGFLTVLQEGHSYVGGYLVTNRWGRPLEFRLTTSVHPNRVQQVLYGQTLTPYICSDLIGKTLIEKTATAVDLIITDSRPVLDLRIHTGQPVAWLTREDASGTTAPLGFCPLEPCRWPLCRHPRFPTDAAAIKAILDHLDGVLDLAEPFTRVREAIG